MSRRRIAANPYLPAESNPFAQQENPTVPTNENIEQGIAPTEPEGPRVVTGPSAPQTAKPRGEVVTVDARLDRMKVAVVCESCGQKGMLRLGQVSERTRCRCGSARVELLEASRKTAYFLEGDDWDYVVDPDGDGLMVVLLEDGQVVDSVGGVDVSYWISDHGNVHIRDHDEDYEYVKSIALEMREQRTGSRRYAEKECTCWEGYERVPGTEPCASGSCRKKSSRRTAVSLVTEFLNVRSQERFKIIYEEHVGWSAWWDAGFADSQEEAYAKAYELAANPDILSVTIERYLKFGDPHPFEKVIIKGRRFKDSRSMYHAKNRMKRRTASAWMRSPNPHHYYKTVVKDGYELNLFASDVDYRWTVDAMVVGNSSTLELYEQGIGTSLEDAKRQAEQSAQFFQG